MPRVKSEKRFKDARTTTGTSTGWVATTESSAVDRDNVVDEAVPVNEPSHRGQMTNVHQFPKAASCTISTSAPDSAYRRYIIYYHIKKIIISVAVILFRQFYDGEK